MNAKCFLILMFVFSDAKSTTNIQSTTQTNIATTTKTVDPYPCFNSNGIGVYIAYDKSKGLTSDQFEAEKDILIKYVFKNWTSVEGLSLISYAERSAKADMLETVDDVIDYIQKDEQVDEEPSLCRLLNYGLKNINVIFVSRVSIADIKECVDTVKSIYLTFFMTFIVLTDNVQIDALRELLPLSQIIIWDTNKMPENWKWRIDTAYRCNINDLGEDKTAYPCGSKIIIAYDESNNISPDALKTQKDFLLNNVFTEKWGIFTNLVLIAYSKTMRISDFGMINSLDDVHSFINSETVDKLIPESLCQVFDTLTTMYIRNVYVVLFVNEFHTSTEIDCSQSINQLRENFESITFVNYTSNVNLQYLLSMFPQSNFISWPIENTKEPDDWSSKFHTAFGCDKYNLNSPVYPCGNTLSIAYEKSYSLNPFAFQRLTNFLLTRLFIDQWKYAFRLYNYADTVNLGGVSTSIEARIFVREGSRVEKEPSFCSVVNLIVEVGDFIKENMIFFVSKFDNKTTPKTDDSCLEQMNQIRDNSKNITVFKLGPLVNETYITELFPAAVIISWDIEHEGELKNWNQVLWDAFGCPGKSPIVLPTTPSPIVTTTTTQLTSTTTVIVPKSTSLNPAFTSPLPTKPITITQTIKTSSHSTKTSNTKVITLVSIFVPIFVVFVLSVITCFCLNKRKTRNQFIDNLIFNGKGKSRKKHIRKKSQIAEDLWIVEVELFVDRKLGSGAFANVYLGKLIGCSGIKRVYPNLLALSHFEDCEVAVKLLPLHATEANKQDFQQEIDFMKNLKYHSHILTLLGYNYGQIILEYCSNGDLLNFLKQKRGNFDASKELKLLISFAWQVADGMQYFSSLNLIHRDLAARNILLTEDCNCKIGDFGLARQGNMHFYTSKGGKIPIRWSPIEVLKSFEYSTKSDVWSYAVLLYEIFSLANLPYFGRENSEVLNYLEDGNRLEQPEHATEEIYNLMMTCWSKEPDDRPNFSQICQKFIPLLEQFNISYNYVDAVANVIDSVDRDEVVV